MTKFKYPLRDSINNIPDQPDNPALEEDISIFQQSFLGLSIVDFTSNLGFNSGESTLTVNLIKDYANFYTPLHALGYRNAVTEGYHPWDKGAFPVDLLEGNYPCKGINKPEEWKKGDDNKDPFTIMGKHYAKYGDIECFPEPGSPVYFKYYDGRDLKEDCINNDYADYGLSGAVDYQRFCKNVFSFGGLLSRWERSISTSGETYTVTVTDPRKILENTMVILNGIADKTSPADEYRIRKPSTDLKGRSYETVSYTHLPLPTTPYV